MNDTGNMFGRICLAVLKGEINAKWLDNKYPGPKKLFPSEHQVSGQHAGHTRNLLLLVHDVVPGHVRLEVEGHLPGHPGEDGEEVGGVGLPLQDVHQRLNKPAACCCVPPAVEAGYGAVDYQKVGMVGNPIKIVRIA